MALLFTHDTLHEGEPVIKVSSSTASDSISPYCLSSPVPFPQGTKYIMRTELMFRRASSTAAVGSSHYGFACPFRSGLSFHS